MSMETKRVAASRRDFLRWTALAGGACALPRALWAAGAPGAPGAPSRPRPNIVYILTDDFGWSDLHVYGRDVVDTPNLDRLAAEGLRFTNAYAACPVCSPTRASIMTGKYPARLHLTDYIPGRPQANTKLLLPDWTKTLTPEHVTVAQALQAAGYATAIVGKWHLECDPLQRGFDEGFVLTKGSPPAGMPRVAEEQTDAAVAFIEKNRARPFFCYLAYNAVHAPLSPRPELREKYAARADGKAKPGPDYFAVVEEMDRGVGRVLAKLDELGLAENTLVVFMSDNGGFSGTTSNAPLRLAKGWLYEGGVRVPLIVRWPGVVKPGTRSDAPVSSIDHFPTIAEAAGLTAPAAVDGVSLVPLLRDGRAPDREAIYWHYPHYHAGPPSSAVRAGDWKLIEFLEDRRVELHDLKSDPSEANDLAAAQPAKAEELRALLNRWREAVGAQMPAPNPDYDPAKSQRRPAAG